MDIQFEKMDESHRTPVIDIFNHYIENSYAAYLEQKVSYDFFSMILGITKGYPAVAVKNSGGEVVGYGFLRAYNPMPVFRHTAEITCFLRPDATGKGIGGEALRHLEREAAAMNVSMLMASISSLNEGSVRFHAKQGFTECGRFIKVGRKFNTDFDVVWMQKRL